MRRTIASNRAQKCGTGSTKPAGYSHDSPEEYEALALSLAREQNLFAAIRHKLAHNRVSAALFDTERFTRHIETAFTTMWERCQRGEPPQSFAVAESMEA